MARPRTLLVIAGGTYQLPLIRLARERGLLTVVFDGSAAAPGLAMADRARVVDIADPEAVTREAREVQPDAVAAIVSEVAVVTVAAVAAALNLPGLAPRVAEACTDKLVMRQSFAAAGLPVPPFAPAATVGEAERAAARIGYPVVVKPVDSSGSRGVRRVDGPADLATAVALALSQSRKRLAIVEGFLDGIECTIETVSCCGTTEILGMSDKVHLPFPYCVSIDLTYPPAFPSDVCAAIAEAARDAIEAVGLESGPAHVEVMLTPQGPVVVELAARGGGYGIFSDILPAISGVDPVACVLDLALGNEPAIRPTRSRAAVLRFFNPAGRGVLRAVTGVQQARAVEDVLCVVVESPIGAPFHGITRDGERPGYVIALGDSREAAVAHADEVERLVRFHIDPAPPDAGGECRVAGEAL